MKRISPGLTAAGIGMSTALAVLMLFAASVTSFVPLSAVCLFFASLMTWIPLRDERGYLFALIEFVSTAGISMLLSRGVWTYLYILLFGCYAILRFFLLTHLNDRVLSVLFRFLAFSLLAELGLAFAEFVLDMDLLVYLPALHPIVWVLILEAGFGIYMALFKVFALLFDSAIRNVLFPKR